MKKLYPESGTGGKNATIIHEGRNFTSSKGGKGEKKKRKKLGLGEDVEGKYIGRLKTG